MRLFPTTNHNASPTVSRWVIIFFLSTFFLQIWRIYSLNATYDQGLFLQEIWNCLHGRPFESTLASELSAPVMFEGQLPQLGYRHLAQHFTPLLILWAPLVAFLGLWSLPLIQVGSISLSGWILFLLAQEKLNPKLAGWIACSFFCTSLVIGPTLENFHDLCIVPLLVFTLLLGVSRNNKFLYFFPALLLPMVREDVGLLSFGIGIWILFRIAHWRLWGLSLCIYSFLYVLLITNQIMPLFGSELSERFLQERFGQYLGSDHRGTLSVLISMAKNPFYLFKELISPVGKTISFLITLALPLAFVPWISLDSWLLISFPLFVALSSQGGNALSVTLRFVLYLVPGIFYGSILWWKKNQHLFEKKLFRKFWRFCLIVAISFALLGNPHRSLSLIIPDSINPWVYISPYEQVKRGLSARKLIKMLPDDSSIAAETHLIPQLSMRRILLRFPENDQFVDTNGDIQAVNYIISQPRFNLSYSAAFRHNAKWVARSLDRIILLTQNGDYGILHCSENGIVLSKEATSNTYQKQCLEKELNHAKSIVKFG